MTHTYTIYMTHTQYMYDTRTQYMTHILYHTHTQHMTHTQYIRDSHYHLLFYYIVLLLLPLSIRHYYQMIDLMVMVVQRTQGLTYHSYPRQTCPNNQESYHICIPGGCTHCHCRSTHCPDRYVCLQYGVCVCMSWGVNISMRVNGCGVTGHGGEWLWGDWSWGEWSWGEWSWGE